MKKDLLSSLSITLDQQKLYRNLETKKDWKKKG